MNKNVDIVERERERERESYTLEKARKNNGITLVALVITIIILLILAGVAIASLTGSGLFQKARLAKEKQENAESEENDRLNIYENEINSILGKTITNGTRNQNENVYSTSEQVIGTWIDGKKIYRKVFNPYKNGQYTENYASPSEGVWTGFDILNNSEVDLVVDSKVITVREDGYMDIYNSCLSNAGHQAIVVNTKGKYIYLYFTQISTFYVILEYTKTTD